MVTGTPQSCKSTLRRDQEALGRITADVIQTTSHPGHPAWCFGRCFRLWGQPGVKCGHHMPPWPLLTLLVHHFSSKFLLCILIFLGSSWLNLPVPQPSETEHSPKKQMSSSEPILDLKTDTTEALPGEKHASLLSWVPAVTPCRATCWSS